MGCTASMVAEDYMDDDGYCAEWHERAVFARKAHRCSECCGEIAKGERHEVADYCMSGEGWRTMRRCINCVALAEMIATKLDLCVPWGALRDFCEDGDREGHSWLNWQEWHKPAEAGAGDEEDGERAK